MSLMFCNTIAGEMAVLQAGQYHYYNDGIINRSGHPEC